MYGVLDVVGVLVVVVGCVVVVLGIVVVIVVVVVVVIVVVLNADLKNNLFVIFVLSNCMYLAYTAHKM